MQTIDIFFFWLLFHSFFRDNFPLLSCVLKGIFLVLFYLWDPDLDLYLHLIHHLLIMSHLLSMAGSIFSVFSTLNPNLWQLWMSTGGFRSSLCIQTELLYIEVEVVFTIWNDNLGMLYCYGRFAALTGFSCSFLLVFFCVIDDHWRSISLCFLPSCSIIERCSRRRCQSVSNRLV